MKLSSIVEPAPRRMGVRATVVRWVGDDPQPGVVEVVLVDADGVRVTLLDKAPVFDGTGRLAPDAAYPQDIVLDCRVCGAEDDGGRVVVELEHGVESVDGRTSFTVAAEQVVRE
ncbi:hypothetical protein E1293_44560 [Actinomadura darangshiensis]|uniref:Uncharacterized protein n=1 Tax=Actinomadura darangshiensis TaxID=705336 RepID=A0A4R4ZS54_9ACTN|nr:hypothetical protein [Actinomadura darangshiensis]TDD61843.1 hypothetical protein E1293_44560 [Actinomadura darangshiensis]